MEQELAAIIAQQQADSDRLSQLMATAGSQAAPQTQMDQVVMAKLQAATCLDLRKDISSVDRFTGEVGELNHFLRSGDGIMARISERERTGRLDTLDAESLRGALVRRVHRHILNQLQVDEGTPWAEVRRRLQKEYGGGRWTPEEDALRMLRMARRPGQTKGDFASQLLVAYQGVVEKYRESLTGPEASARLQVIESLAVVQLGEAAGKPITGGLLEAANALVDAAGRGEEETPTWPRAVRAWPNPPRRAEARPRRSRDQGGLRREEPRTAARRPGGRREEPRQDSRRCYSCGKTGHLQAKCSHVACFQCGGKGHVARACPYRPPPRRPREEPMEVNVHRPGRRSRTQEDGADARRASGSSESDDSGTQESDASSIMTTYAAVVRKKQTARGDGRGRGGQNI